MTPRHWLATVSAKSPFKHNLDTGRDDDLWPDNLMAHVDAHQGVIERREIMWERDRIASGDVVWLYAAAPYKVICAMARVVQVHPVDSPPTIELVWDVDVCSALTRNRIAWTGRPEPRRPGLELKEPMLSTALRWLDDHHLGVAAWNESDGDALSENDARTRAVVWAVLRPGQQAFRQRLLDHYEACVITGERTPDVLDAAHITPFSGPHSDGLENGLLLRTDLHRLFDRHLFSIDGDRLVVAEPLLGTFYESLLTTSFSDDVAKSASPAHLRDHYTRFRELFPS
jgi:hypothetical protein